MKKALQSRSRLWVSVVMLMGLFTLGQTACAQRDRQTKPVHTIRPFVVMKQSEISGRVFVLLDEQDKGQPKAKNRKGIHIKLQFSEQDAVVCKTATDEGGHFVLPSLDVGAYRLTVGRLSMDLRVEDPAANTEPVKQVSKTIVVFIPEELAD